MQDLRISLVQGDTRWHDPAGNRAHYGALLAPLAGATDLVVLPETFTSGFSNEAIDQAEGMDGRPWPGSASRLRAWARRSPVACSCAPARACSTACCSPRPTAGCSTTTSATCSAMPTSTSAAAGRDRLTVEWKGWRINPQVCYDLRFPVFCRNRYDVERPGQLDFDLQLFVANWPSARAYAWRTLLRARAIENLCFVAAVNRVGVDGASLHYAGDSAVIDFLGQPQLEIREREQVATTTISAAALAEHRARFPAMLDADAFELGGVNAAR